MTEPLLTREIEEVVKRAVAVYSTVENVTAFETVLRQSLDDTLRMHGSLTARWDDTDE